MSEANDFIKKREFSEGELFLQEYFMENEIEFKEEFKTQNLKGDSKSYRVADFYLPEYKVFVEFFGQWNHEQHKERYLEKKRVYKLNNIPCIYLYPENLGVMDFIFHKRLTVVLRDNNLKWQLFKWRFKRNRLKKLKNSSNK